MHWLPTAGFPINFRKGPHHLSKDGFSESGGIYTWLNFSYTKNDPGDVSFGSIFCGIVLEGTENITVPISFLDKTYSIKAQRVGGEDSASMSITAEEYWPYDPGDGLGPIYNSTTGAQLRGFPG